MSAWRPIFSRVISAVALLSACDAEVSLGRWGIRPGGTPTDTAATGATSGSSDVELDAATDVASSGGESVTDSGADASTFPTPRCGEDLGSGVASVLAETLYVTETSTDWSFPEPTTAMEWDLTIERDVPDGPATVGYYWHNQFSFVPGVAGRLGFQTNGIYQADPARPGESETAPMLVFWLSGPPLAAELGDIPFPDARVAATPAAGLNWQTIHAKYDLQECHTYRFRIGVESTTEEGVWYGAWVTDTTTEERLFLGRMLLPNDSGLLSTFSSSRTEQIIFPASTCSDLHSASALFGAPVSDSGAVASHEADHFAPPFGCRRSLIADFGDIVRHEMSVAP